MAACCEPKLCSTIDKMGKNSEIVEPLDGLVGSPIHGVLKARILKWFAIPFSSGPCFVRTLHHDALATSHHDPSATSPS